MTTANSVNDDIHQLWLKFSSSQSNEVRQTLILHYDYLIKKIAGGLFANRIDDDVEYEEFYQLGVVGLIESIDRYDPVKGASFDTYASYRIRGAILNGLTKMTEKREQIAFRQSLSRERLSSLAEGESLNTFEELVELTLGTALGLILEDTALIQQNDKMSNDNTHEQYQLFEYKALLSALLFKLNDKERFIIESHYFEYNNFETIASILSLSKGRVSQLHKQSLLKLRNLMSQEKNIDHFY